MKAFEWVGRLTVAACCMVFGGSILSADSVLNPWQADHSYLVEVLRIWNFMGFISMIVATVAVVCGPSKGKKKG
jgi:hypothetical protein